MNQYYIINDYECEFNINEDMCLVNLINENDSYFDTKIMVIIKNGKVLVDKDFIDDTPLKFPTSFALEVDCESMSNKHIGKLKINIDTTKEYEVVSIS